ncbi:nitroreductase/quinone reductase family protein [Miltoncostaea marina]|uniref:nitroreductase/quinone reductase family protein n=1 Tax=Miltoncostaea marina TaxID=2843215 RepID=UPI001C3DE1E1|nr:nitroreductase/quinone reductase family protein [Miltoncostaea marina]
MISARGRGVGVPARALNGVIALLVGRLGLPLPGLRMLRVHGRRSGRLRSTPVLVLRRRGRRYLVAPRGRTDWARNLDAAGWGELIHGRRTERFRATPVGGDERAAVVAAYVRRFGWLTGRFFDLPRRPTADQARRVAGRHPVFRVGATLLLSLALAGPAAAARPSFAIPAGGLPEDAATARATLREASREAPPGSRTRADIGYVLRLADRHLGPREPEGRRATVLRTLQVNAWYYARRGAPGSRAIIRDPDGVLSTYWERRGFAVNPVATAGRWQDLNAGLSPERLASALLPYGVARRAGRARFLLWEYYDVPDVPGAIRPGASGMAQGRIAQLMARAYHRTGDPRFAAAATGALRAFQVPVAAGGVRSRVSTPQVRRPRPWFVERAYPGASPWKGAALNGFMVTIINLETTGPLLTSRPQPRRTGPREQRVRPRAPGAMAGGRLARALARAGEATLIRYLPVHDTGRWSLYGLLTPGRPWASYLADENYHCYHVTLLRQLERQAPMVGFDQYADLWARYARRAGVTCRRVEPYLGGGAGLFRPER